LHLNQYQNYRNNKKRIGIFVISRKAAESQSLKTVFLAS
jgi:hypothetical protein